MSATGLKISSWIWNWGLMIFSNSNMSGLSTINNIQCAWGSPYSCPSTLCPGLNLRWRCSNVLMEHEVLSIMDMVVLRPKIFEQNLIRGFARLKVLMKVKEDSSSRTCLSYLIRFITGLWLGTIRRLYFLTLWLDSELLDIVVYFMVGARSFPLPCLPTITKKLLQLPLLFFATIFQCDVAFWRKIIPWTKICFSLNFSRF